MIEQLERDSSNPAGQPQPLTVVISKGVDAAAPVVIEVVVDKDGPVSLELLTKLLIVGVVFLATRHIAPSLAIVGAILAAFIPDVITSVVRRRRWGKKRVGLLAALFTFFAALDSAFAKAMRLRGRKSPRPGRAGGRRALGLGHAVSTTAVAAAICAVAIAVPAVASGGSPFPVSQAHTPRAVSHASTPLAGPRAHTPLAGPVAHTPLPRTHTSPSTVTQPAPTTPAHSGGSHGASTPSTSRDRFVRVGVSPTGVPGSVALAPAERVHLEFTLTQPSHVVFGVGARSTLTDFNIWRDANQNGSDSIAVDSTDPYAVPGQLAAGTHTITIESTAARAGTLLFVLYASTDRTLQAGVSATGVPGSLSVTPGQRVHLQFTLEQPSHVVFALTADSTLTGFDIFRDQDQDATDSIAVDSNDPYAVPGLLAAGPHTITIEPTGANAGSLVYILYASVDLSQTVDASPDGTAGAIKVAPGQRANLVFTLKQPSHVMLAVNPNSTLSDFDIFRDDNQDASNSIAVDSTQPYAPGDLLQAGTHTITIEPSRASAGALLFTLTARPG